MPALMQVINTNNVENTWNLVTVYNTTQSPQERVYLREIINQMISGFFQKNILSPAVVKEFSLLAYCQDISIIRAILEKLGESIKNSRIFKPDILNCLTAIFLTVNPEYFRENQSILIQLGLILLEHLSPNTHFSPSTYPQVRDVFNALQALSFVMLNSDIAKLERDQLWPQFSERINKLSKHSYYPIQFKAKYISQSMVRIKSDESELARKARKAFSIVIGVVKVGSALYTQKYGGIVKGFGLLKEGFSREIEKRDWYWSITTLNMMALCVIANSNYFGSFMGLIKGLSGKINRSKEQVYGVAECLHNIALNSSERAIKRECIILLGEIYRDKQIWGQYQDIRREILEMLLGLLSDNEAEDVATRVLNGLKVHFASKKKNSEGRKIIEKRIPEDLASAARLAKLYPSLSGIMPSDELYRGVCVKLRRDTTLLGLGDDGKEVSLYLQAMERSLLAIQESVHRLEAAKIQDKKNEIDEIRKKVAAQEQELARLQRHIQKGIDTVSQESLSWFEQKLAKCRKKLDSAARKFILQRDITTPNKLQTVNTGAETAGVEISRTDTSKLVVMVEAKERCEVVIDKSKAKKSVKVLLESTEEAQLNMHDVSAVGSIKSKTDSKKTKVVMIGIKAGGDITTITGKETMRDIDKKFEDVFISDSDSE